MAETKQYRYKAKSIAALASIVRPKKAETAEEGKSELREGRPDYQSATVQDYALERYLTFRSAHTQVTGNEGPAGVHNTLMTSRIENLNILDVVTADLVVARLTAEYRIEDGNHFSDLWVTPLGTTFANLRIAGHPIEVPLPEGSRFAPDKPHSYEDFRMVRLGGPYNPVARGFPGTSIVVPGVGTFTFASLAVQKDPEIMGAHDYTLTMIRAELGSPVGGHLVLANGSVGGGGGAPAPNQ
jgi:hypothetical protein